nr:MAG TPA: hypothetical protein [Microviridae sp.]
MLKNGQIVYCPPPFEEVQNEPTRMSNDGSVIMECSLHSDVSLMMRIDALDKLSAQQYVTLKEQLQPLIDSSSFRDDFEKSFGKLSDEELLQSCPSRYLQTESEQLSYLRNLAKADKDARIKAAEEQSKAEEKQKLLDESKLFDEAIRKIFEK